MSSDWHARPSIWPSVGTARIDATFDYRHTIRLVGIWQIEGSNSQTSHGGAAEYQQHLLHEQLCAGPALNACLRVAHLQLQYKAEEPPFQYGRGRLWIWKKDGRVSTASPKEPRRGGLTEQPSSPRFFWRSSLPRRLWIWKKGGRASPKANCFWTSSTSQSTNCCALWGPSTQICGISCRYSLQTIGLERSRRTQRLMNSLCLWQARRKWSTIAEGGLCRLAP